MFSDLPPKADLPPDLRTTPAASFSRTPPLRPRGITVRRRAILSMPKGERPQPWLADRRGSRLHVLVEIGNSWPPQTTRANWKLRRSSAAIATSRADHRKP